MELRIQLAKHTLLSTDPVLFDAIYVIGGNKVDESMKSANKFVENIFEKVNYFLVIFHITPDPG